MYITSKPPQYVVGEVFLKEPILIKGVEEITSLIKEEITPLTTKKNCLLTMVSTTQAMRLICFVYHFWEISVSCIEKQV